ncbi:MAG: undecaprenyl-diphosphate phosphatase [Elusimicrobiaceae bacterium]|nr:undecaprenyl-diphosphate phosphatase [Elusimicrobiaceae bacterium]
MSTFDAILLGLLQALGEFLPISSSAHLVLLPFFRGQAYQGVSFDVLLHLATLLAVLLYFAKDWISLIKNGLSQPFSQKGKPLWLLALATLPAAVAGVLFKEQVETIFRSPVSIACCLMIFAVLLWWADRQSNTEKAPLFSAKNLLIIGCAQALALMPGVSRSGITITAALFLGFSRSQSARISFLLSAPVIAGAALLEVSHLSPDDISAPLIWGFISAFLGALAVISGLMKYIQKHNFTVFVIYRLLLGLFILFWYFR